MQICLEGASLCYQEANQTLFIFNNCYGFDLVISHTKLSLHWYLHTEIFLKSITCRTHAFKFSIFFVGVLENFGGVHPLPEPPLENLLLRSSDFFDNPRCAPGDRRDIRLKYAAFS